MAEPAEHECPVCHQVLDISSTEDPVHVSLCAHQLHKYCLDGMMAALEPGAEFRCPTCRKAPSDLSRLEAEIMAPPIPPMTAIEISPSTTAASMEGIETSPSVGEAAADAEDDASPSAMASTEAVIPPTLAAAAPLSENVIAASEFGFDTAEQPSKRARPSLELVHVDANIPTVACVTCGTSVGITKCRIKSKSAGTFWCLVCQSRTTQLFRMYGSWPTPHYKTFQASDQVTFFAEIRDCHNLDQLKTKSNELFSRYVTNEDSFSEGGAYYPLGVWRTKGFDADRIKELTLPCDIREHSVLGTTYRVRIYSQLASGAWGWKRSSDLSSKPSAAKAIKDAETDRPKAEEDNTGEDDEDGDKDGDKDGDEDSGEDSDEASTSDSSSGSSSSSSSDDKKKKKGKGSKKKKKSGNKKKKAAHKKRKDAKKAKKTQLKERAKAREELSAKKAAEKEAKKNGKVAEQIFNKSVECKSKIMAVMGQPNYMHVGEPVRTPLETIFRTLSKVEKESKAVVENPRLELEECGSMKDVVLFLFLFTVSGFPLFNNYW